MTRESICLSNFFRLRASNSLNPFICWNWSIVIGLSWSDILWRAVQSFSKFCGSWRILLPFSDKDLRQTRLQIDEGTSSIEFPFARNSSRELQPPIDSGSSFSLLSDTLSIDILRKSPTLLGRDSKEFWEIESCWRFDREPNSSGKIEILFLSRVRILRFRRCPMLAGMISIKLPAKTYRNRKKQQGWLQPP